MHGYWSFELELPQSKRRRSLVLFCAKTNPEEEEVAERLEAYCDNHLSPDRIYIISPETEKHIIQQVVESKKFQGRIRDATQHQNSPKSECLSFDINGRLFDSNRNIFDSVLAGVIKRQGLTQLIREKHVLRTAPSTHHFVVPSGGHAQSFFRTGDALTDGAAIEFLAFCCLPYINPYIRHIYCDSGTIFPVAYAIGILRKRIDNATLFVNINSFESYSGLKTFQFRDIDRSTILISVTTTGRLAQELGKCHTLIPHQAVVHLFALCSLLDFPNVVCDLRRHEQDNPHGFSEVPTYSQANCPLCVRRSSLIRISSEQFLPGDIVRKQLVLLTRHKPDWLDPFLARTVGRGLIKANYKSEHTRHATSDIFFDSEKLFTDPAMLGINYYIERLRWLTDLAIPAKLIRIVHVDGPASKLMAEMIRQQIQDQLPNVVIHSYAEILANQESHIRDSGATLVVAAAAASGRSLLSVSQTLRTIQPNGAIGYIIGFSRFHSAETANEITNNLTFRDQSSKFGLHVFDRVHLPLTDNLEETCWQQEKELIAQLQRISTDTGVDDILDKRMQSLRIASSHSTRGMLNDLFWENRHGVPLNLRPRFALFNFTQPDTTSQADVFFTITAILHSLRFRRDGEDSLFQHEHVHKVLSPRCFDRFNDGVIQSCLLRAALPPELDYSADDQLSMEMTQVLDVILTSSETNTGEASREFLLALALKRLQIKPNHLQSLKVSYSDGRGDPIAKLLWTEISDKDRDKN